MPYSLKSSAVLRRELDGKGVLFDTATGAVFVLNATGVAICGKLSAPVSLEEISSHLRKEMDCPENLQEDILDFLASLRERELLVEDARTDGE